MTEELRQRTPDQEARQTVEGIFRRLTEEQKRDLVFGLLKQCATLVADYARIRTEVETLRASLRDALQETSDGKSKDDRIATLEKELAEYRRGHQQFQDDLATAGQLTDSGIKRIQEEIEALASANKSLQQINQALQKELEELRGNLKGLDEIFEDPEFSEKIDKLEAAVKRATDLQKLLDEMTVERNKWLERVKALLGHVKALEEAGTPAPKEKSGGRRMIKPAMALLGLTCTAAAVPAGNAIMNETSLARYCADDTVEGTFYEMNGQPFAPKDDVPRVILGLYQRQEGEDGGSNYIATILLTPPSHSGTTILSRDCRFRTGELPRVLATHPTGRSSSLYVRIAEGTGHRWLHFEPSVKPKKLKWEGKTTHVGTTVAKGERIVLAVDGKKIITEMILTDTPSTSVNVGFMFAAHWFSSRFTDRLGLSRTIVTNEAAFNHMNSVTAPGIDWVEARREGAREATQAKDKKSIIPLLAGVVALVLGSILLAYDSYRSRIRHIPPTRHARHRTKTKGK